MKLQLVVLLVPIVLVTTGFAVHDASSIRRHFSNENDYAFLTRNGEPVDITKRLESGVSDLDEEDKLEYDAVDYNNDDDNVDDYLLEEDMEEEVLENDDTERENTAEDDFYGTELPEHQSLEKAHNWTEVAGSTSYILPSTSERRYQPPSTSEQAPVDKKCARRIKLCETAECKKRVRLECSRLLKQRPKAAAKIKGRGSLEKPPSAAKQRVTATSPATTPSPTVATRDSSTRRTATTTPTRNRRTKPPGRKVVRRSRRRRRRQTKPSGRKAVRRSRRRRRRKTKPSGRKVIRRNRRRRRRTSRKAGKKTTRRRRKRRRRSRQ